ncbi:unnamed protein product [Malus baccata var. baccata]
MIQKPLLAHKFEENYRFMNKDWVFVSGDSTFSLRPLALYFHVLDVSLFFFIYFSFFNVSDSNYGYRKKDIQISIEKGSDYLISMATGNGKTSPSIEYAYMPFDNTPVVIEAFNMSLSCSCRTSCF